MKKVFFLFAVIVSLSACTKSMDEQPEPIEPIDEEAPASWCCGHVHTVRTAGLCEAYLKCK
jgi:hypothetical protein